MCWRRGVLGRVCGRAGRGEREGCRVVLAGGRTRWKGGVLGARVLGDECRTIPEDKRSR